MNGTLFDTAKGLAVLAALGVALYVLFKGKQAVDAVANAASDAIDSARVLTNQRPGEAPASNVFSRGVDAAIFGTTTDAAGDTVAAGSLGDWLYQNYPGLGDIIVGD